MTAGSSDRPTQGPETPGGVDESQTVSGDVEGDGAGRPTSLDARPSDRLKTARAWLDPARPRPGHDKSSDGPLPEAALAGGAPPGAEAAVSAGDEVADEEGFPRLSGPRLRENIAIVGFILLVGLVIQLTVFTILWPDVGIALWRMWALEMVTGREGGIPTAVGTVPNLLIAQVSATQDIAIASIMYPAFLYLIARYRHRDNLVMRRLRRLEARAHTKRHFVKRWGPAGVFAFMLVPFLINGPLLGAAIGRLAGVPTRFLILPVVGATIVASLAWTYAYDALFGIVDPGVAPILTAAIVGSLVAWSLLGEWRERRTKEKQAADVPA